MKPLYAWLLIGVAVFVAGRIIYDAYRTPVAVLIPTHQQQLSGSTQQVPAISVTQQPSATVVPVQGKLTVTGTIRKEKIPAELELGDTWYWMYFDTPFRLEENASGIPQDMTKLQIVPAGNSQVQIDALLGRHVRVTGKIGWGYAESNVIEAASVTEAK